MSLYSEGDTISTGKPITLDYLRNLTKSPKMGERFAQHIEPRGEYMVFNSRPNKDTPDFGRFEAGQITFRNPLVLEHKTTIAGGWKSDLSAMFGGKTGAVLTNAIASAGYDGIITTEIHRGKLITSEIVNIGGVKSKPLIVSVSGKAKYAVTDIKGKSSKTDHNLSAGLMISNLE